MSRADARPKLRARFTLFHLLALTALVAVWVAAGLAYRQHGELTARRDALLDIAPKLIVTDPSKLHRVDLPQFSYDFHSWQVHVPEGQRYELRLGVGDVSQAGVASDFDAVSITGGEHRVSLQTADSKEEGYRYVVFLDGKEVLQHVMGREWMPDGWSQASTVSWPGKRREDASPLQLMCRGYTPRISFGKGNSFNGQSDSWRTMPGYRLWIDRAGSEVPLPTPFVGFAEPAGYSGTGLRDGLRLGQSQRGQNVWSFTRPASQLSGPVLRIVPEFRSEHGWVLTDQTFTAWELSGSAHAKRSLSADSERPQLRTAYLLQRVPSAPAAPVVALRWDAERPDDLGLRLAESPFNEGFTRWRLKIVAGGGEHLWRLLQMGDAQLDARREEDWPSGEDEDNASADTSVKSPALQQHAIELPKPAEGKPYQLRWRTNETEPLQFLNHWSNRQSPYAGMQFYRGLPVRFGLSIPQELKPQLSVVRKTTRPGDSAAAFPGGPVIESLQIELDAQSDVWIWLRVEHAR